MHWTWDEAENAANLLAHGLSLEVAAFVFDDPLAATQEDPYPYMQRWRTIGAVGAQVVMAVHTWPKVDAETGEEIGRIISHVKRRDAKGSLMKKDITELSPEVQKQIKAIEALPDDRIDTTDAPEILDWSDARRGVFYRPVKKQITLRLDADIIAWFKAQARDGRGYQTDINRALRQHVQRTMG